MVLRGPDGQTVVRGYALREPGGRGRGGFRIQTDTGEKYTMEHYPKPRAKTRREERRGERRGHGMQPPEGLPVAGPSQNGGLLAAPALWLFVDAGHHGPAVALARYPVIRRLTPAAEKPCSAA